MRVSLVAAMAQNRVIGRDNQMPWHLPEDLKHFKKLTSGHPIVMGRKTFESLGRPLPNRANIVISRNPGFRADGVQVVPNLEAALELSQKGSPSGPNEVFVIGGAEIYRLALPRADRIYLTVIGRSFDGDATFPEFSLSEFKEAKKESHLSESSERLPYSFIVYDRT